MKVRKSVAGVTTVAILLFCNGTKSEAATLTCGSVAQIIIDSSTPRVPHADIPMGGTFVSLDVYTRKAGPGEPWKHCPKLEGDCENLISIKEAYSARDDVDHVTTYRATISPYSGGTIFTSISVSRLVVTYKTDQPECLSQATYYVNPGSQEEFRLYTPPNAGISTFRDWLRDLSEKNQPWVMCDDYNNKPKAIVNACRDPYTFQFYPSDEGDSGDNTAGKRFVCSAKPDNSWVDKARLCRAAVVYRPNAEPTPGMPSELE